ncbi:MAG: sensor histidine kinase [Firmicutes bacterium]|nr:sensor histidine kinase [Alicyclobacillaceae bacterium]MCL6497578.1 sensor histidine kinase [Bacillota bacterium]
MQEPEPIAERRRYGRLKWLTTAGPTAFVTVAEVVRFVFLRRWLPPAEVSLVAILVTLVGAAAFSSFVFGIVERMERERTAYKEAMLALKERERLAREMHDGLAQNLAAINLKVHRLSHLLAQRDLEAMAEELVAVQAAVNLSYTEVRQSLYDLKAGQRLAEGFWTALEKQAEEFHRQTGVAVRVEPLPDRQEPWNEMAAVQMLRIVQECLANVRRHAEAHQVRIWGTIQNGEFRLTVADDGKGFEPGQERDRGHHFGLSIMQERAESVGGRVVVQSTVGKGTEVTVVIPIR